MCIVSLITSLISFGLPLFRKCTPCPEADANSGIECPRRPGMYGNYVNVIDWFSLTYSVHLTYTVSPTLKLWFLLNTYTECIMLQFYCGDKEYNDLATIFFNTQVS